MGDTKISWTMGDDGVMGKTWNPIRGCSRVSEGCRNCYAERIAVRFSAPGQPYHGLAQVVAPRDDLDRVGGRRNGWTRKVVMVPEHLADPLRWRKPRRIFVNSMSDLFHETLTNEQIAAVFGVMAAARQHTFQVLTKRAKRMREWFEWIAAFKTPLRTIEYSPRLVCAVCAKEHGVEVGTVADPRAWPLLNVWMGVSVENQDAAAERIPELLRTPAAVRFLSCEPLIGPIDLANASTNERSLVEDLDWIIAGCESGANARPCDVSWLRSLRDQCAEAGVPYFLKQASTVEASPSPDVATIGFSRHRPIDTGPGSKRKGGGVIELPYLDGVQHASFPEARP